MQCSRPISGQAQKHALRLGMQSSPVYENTKGRALSAQLVLAVVKIDGSFDANGCVYGSHQGGRHLGAHIRVNEMQVNYSIRSTIRSDEHLAICACCVHVEYMRQHTHYAP